jgi:hypothetical protein
VWRVWGDGGHLDAIWLAARLIKILAGFIEQAHRQRMLL